MSFAKYRIQVKYQGKIREKIGNSVSNKTLPPYPLLSHIKKLFRIKQITKT